ncbi:MAG: ribosome assembly RNA-binding protein YhbY [Pisciglobus halotolerans]|nr:ribosome assembly RNA-binding protein YhbY [Pisciglobus halotolerans]
MKLTGKQKSFLKSKAHHLKPIFQIGKNGLNDELIKQIGEAVEKRELIKINLLQNTAEEITDAANVIEEAIGGQVIQIIGRVIVLFKKSTQEKYHRISLEIPNNKNEN